MPMILQSKTAKGGSRDAREIDIQARAGMQSFDSLSVRHARHVFGKDAQHSPVGCLIILHCLDFFHSMKIHMAIGDRLQPGVEAWAWSFCRLMNCGLA